MKLTDDIHNPGELNSIHITSRPVLVASVMSFLLFFGQRSQERYPGRAFFPSSPRRFH